MANSKADGSVNFDTKIDTSGFEKGLKQIDKSSEKAAKNVEKDTEKSSKNAEKKAGNAADGISKSFAKSSGKMQSSMQEAGDKPDLSIPCCYCRSPKRVQPQIYISFFQKTRHRTDETGSTSACRKT